MKNERLNNYYKEQLDFLKLSCESFDRGFIHEAKRLATTLRVLLHDTSSSHSLLNQLGIKSKLGFIDTCFDFDSKNLASQNGLLVVKVTNKSINYKAPLSENPLGVNHSKRFDSWWNKLVIANNSKDGFSRKKIVLDLANKEGGAHVDPRLNKRFESLKNGEYFNVYFTKGDNDEAIKEAPAYAVRQIAFEVITTLTNMRRPNNKPTTMEYLFRPKPKVNTEKKINRNDPCPCKSGKKYKKCCLK